jgi:ribosomal protein L16 Arg81 hydroxylase
MNGVGQPDYNEESRVLREILQKIPTQQFFQQTWQQKAQIFRFSPETTVDTASQAGGGTWNDDQMQQAPLDEMVKQRWHILRKLFQQVEQMQGSHRFHDSSEPPPEHETPLIFQEKELQSREEVEELYGNSLFAPYLNGCSVVLNHGDLSSPWIAALCQDLQKTFPHAYANCYLTPPNSQAVPAHADDRDVLVFQLVGSKNWQVYQKVPVPFPYPHEQVGKQGVEVPNEVLTGPVAVSTTLRPGDVLYMPRGFVHQANCSDCLSFHVTVALATHDWSLAGIMSMATKTILTRSVDYRKSVLPVFTDSDVKGLQDQIDTAMSMIREEVTAENLLRSLKDRLEQHNQRAFPLRMKLIHEARFPSNDQPAPAGNTGALAATNLSFESVVRASTPEERSKASPESATQTRGLNVREEIADSILSIISRLKSDLSLTCKVVELRKLMSTDNPLVCDLALLSLTKQAVALGAFAVVSYS